MHPNAERVDAALRAGGVTAEIREFTEATRTAADGEPVLVLASGDHQVDTTAVARALGAAHVGRADADLVRDATGFAIGGVPPLAHPHPLRTLIDTHLATYDVLWAAAGTPNSVFAIGYDDLARVANATPADVAAR